MHLLQVLRTSGKYHKCTYSLVSAISNPVLGVMLASNQDPTKTEELNEVSAEQSGKQCLNIIFFGIGGEFWLYLPPGESTVAPLSLGPHRY